MSSADRWTVTETTVPMGSERAYVCVESASGAGTRLLVVDAIDLADYPLGSAVDAEQAEKGKRVI